MEQQGASRRELEVAMDASPSAQPLLESASSVFDPLSAPSQHQRSETVTNIAEVYKLVELETANCDAANSSSESSPVAAHGDGTPAFAPPLNAVVAGAVANLCSATLGAGVLALPFALLQAGIIVGSILLVVSATATALSIRLLVRAADHYNLHTYETLAEQVISPRCRSAVEACMLIFCGGCAVAYMIAVGDILQQSGLLLDNSRTYSMMLAWVMAMMPLSMLRRMQSLQFASAVGIAAIGTLVFSSFVHYMTDLDKEHSSHKNATKVFDSAPPPQHTTVDFKDFLWPAHGLVSVLTAAPVVLFAFSCQTNVCQIYQELAVPDNCSRQGVMRRVTITAVCICAALYSSVSVISLADFGSAVMPNMLSQYHNAGQIMQVATAAMAFAVIMAFPLNIFPARNTMIGLIEQHGSYKPPTVPPIEAGSAEIASDLIPNENLTAALLEDVAEEQPPVEESSDDVDSHVESAHQITPLHLQPEEGSPTNDLQPNTTTVETEADTFDFQLHILTTLFLTGMALALALVLPNISVVFGLLGGTASAMLGFCVPGLLGCQLCKDLKEETGELQLGMLVTSWLLLGGGVAVGILTTGVTVYNIVHHSSSL